MTTATLRKVGGSIMIAIPPALLDVTELRVDMEVGLTVSNGSIVIQSKKKRAYTLGDLVSRCDLAEGVGEREWVDAQAIGGELL